jgi:UDP-N-acetylmuramoyl-L-alanyl-D-glutamate--2,6-diaminopimelate ligase
MNAPQILAWLGAHAPAALRAHLQADSRRVARGDVFVAMPGAIAGKSRDGREFIDAAVAAGASAVIAEAEGLSEWRTPASYSFERSSAVPSPPTPLPEGEGRKKPSPSGRGWREAPGEGTAPKPSEGKTEPPPPLLPVPKLRAQIGPLAAQFYGEPSTHLRAIGVTGTNGKTSCTHWIAQSLSRLGTRCAVIGTVGSGFPGALSAEAGLTTPDAIGLQRELRRLLDAGAAAVAMEVSSIGLVQGRADGMNFEVALFTNLTRDHLDHHGDMAAYEAAKTLLFDWPTLTHAVVNLDDAMGQRLAARLRGRRVQVIGTSVDADPEVSMAVHLRASNVRTTPDGLSFDATLTRAGVAEQTVPVACALVGSFNVANALGVIGVLLACGVALRDAAACAAHWVPPPGRMQRIGAPGAPIAVIDYAHTPDALEKALGALRPLAVARGGKLWVVFGAGGDRDPGKRAPMGASASGADRIVVTSDNPRTEDPQAIVDAVARGVAAERACERIVDRAQAIARALTQAAPADVVLIAGKGHEDYQDIGGRKLPFSDVAQARAALAARGHGAPA